MRRVTMHSCSIVTVGDPEDSIVAPLGSADVFGLPEFQDGYRYALLPGYGLRV